jgi:anti-sigma regulatory factor (Ser/Thr protein kinase)
MLTGTSVLGTVTIPGRERDVCRARSFVDSVLGLDHPCTDITRLLVSELVTNAVQHSDSRHPGGIVRVAIIDMPGGLRVEVADGGSAGSMPVVKEDMLAASGRGLYLVQTLADEWGYQRDAMGTTVWFQLTSVWPPGTRWSGDQPALAADSTAAQMRSRSSAPVT